MTHRLARDPTDDEVVAVLRSLGRGPTLEVSLAVAEDLPDVMITEEALRAQLHRLSQEGRIVCDRRGGGRGMHFVWWVP